MGMQTEALIHGSSRLLRVLTARSSKGSRVICPILKKAHVFLSRAFLQPNSYSTWTHFRGVRWSINIPWASHSLSLSLYML